MATLEDNLRNDLASKYPADKGYEVKVEGVGQALSPVKVVVYFNGAEVKSATSTITYAELLGKL